MFKKAHELIVTILTALCQSIGIIGKGVNEADLEMDGFCEVNTARRHKRLTAAYADSGLTYVAPAAMQALQEEAASAPTEEAPTPADK